MADSALHFRPSPQLSAWLESRAERAASSVPMRARTELTMWADILAASLGLHTWTLPELETLTQAAAGNHVTDSCRTGMDATGIAEAEVWDWLAGDRGAAKAPAMVALVDKLHALTPAEDVALLDAVSRWWRLDAGRRTMDAEGWAQVGIRVTA